MSNNKYKMPGNARKSRKIFEIRVMLGSVRNIITFLGN